MVESQDSLEDQCLDGRGILVFLEDRVFEPLRSCSIMVYLGIPLEIPTPTPDQKIRKTDPKAANKQ